MAFVRSLRPLLGKVYQGHRCLDRLDVLCNKSSLRIFGLNPSNFCTSSTKSPGDQEKPYFQDQSDDRVFAKVTLDKFRELIKSKEDEESIKSILDEYEYLKYTTFRVPTDIRVREMAEMMNMIGIRRTKFFEYMFKKEMDEAGDKRRRERKKQQALEKRQREDQETGFLKYSPGTLFTDENKPIYRKWHNAMFLRIPDGQMNAVHDSKKQEAAMFGQKLVFDMSYEEYMDKPQVINLCDQMTICYGLNYRSKRPFDLWFCNYSFGSFTDEKMRLAIGNLTDPVNMISLECKSYVDVFPKEKLLYLSPHAPDTYTEFNEDDILIIGGFVDKKNSKPISYAKCKKEGIRSAKLPIDEHVAWQGSKRLTLNQTMGVLLEVKETKDWREAFFKHTPKRKLKTLEQLAEEEARREAKARRTKKNFFKISF